MEDSNLKARVENLENTVAELGKSTITISQALIAEQRNQRELLAVVIALMKSQANGRRQITELFRRFADAVLPDWGHDPLKDLIAQFEQSDEHIQAIMAEMEARIATALDGKGKKL